MMGENTTERAISLEEEAFWQLLAEHEGQPFRTAKNLEFTYTIRGYEMFVSRKDKSLTRATVMMAYRKAMELQADGGSVTGPKKLGTFGASYLYPVFIALGVIKKYGKVHLDKAK